MYNNWLLLKKKKKKWHRHSILRRWGMHRCLPLLRHLGNSQVNKVDIGHVLTGVAIYRGQPLRNKKIYFVGHLGGSVS